MSRHHGVGAVAVVVPAHDERELLPACLASLRVAARHPALRRLDVHVLPVLDACSDGTVAPGALEITARNVGVARGAGFAAALAREAGRPAEQLWLATTDADSTVPPDWLAVQLRLAARGAEAVTGTVRVADWGRQPARVRRAFARTYGTPPDGHLHVHGANLGVSAAAYLAVGGMPPLPVSEDQALVDELRAAGRRVVATGCIPVRTSARRQGRAAGGFADHLRGLDGAAYLGRPCQQAEATSSMRARTGSPTP